MRVFAEFDVAAKMIVVAHRGSSQKAPENTVSAIEAALEDGADYVEVDVRQTADGTPVLLHDRDLRRVAGARHLIWQVKDAELATIEVGSWFGPRFKDERIPTLAQAIAAIQGRGKLYLEIKAGPQIDALTRNVVETLRKWEVVEETIVAASSKPILDHVGELEPKLQRALVLRSATDALEREGMDLLSLRAAAATTEQVALAHRHGQSLHVWTVNSRSEMTRLMDMGVDGIITDVPDVLVEVLAEREGFGPQGRPESP